MASILEFKPPAIDVRRASATGAPTATADIVLFPGVRYERWAESPPDAEKPRCRARRRDHLEFDD